MSLSEISGTVLEENQSKRFSRWGTRDDETRGDFHAVDRHHISTIVHRSTPSTPHIVAHAISPMNHIHDVPSSKGREQHSPGVDQTFCIILLPQKRCGCGYFVSLFHQLVIHSFSHPTQVRSHAGTRHRCFGVYRRVCGDTTA